MNTRNIKAVRLWQNGSAQNANVIMLFDFGGYTFTASDSYVSYHLGKFATITTPDGDTREEFIILAGGSVSLPYTVVQNWGEDDQPIFDYVINALNLTAA